MKSICKFLLGAFLSIGLIAATGATEKGSREEAVELVHRAIAFYEANGKDKTFAEINNRSRQFIDRDLYVYIIDIDGMTMAHGANERLIGRDMSIMKDADGKLFARELIALMKANGSGWVDYKWPNPVTRKIESKTTYIELFDGYGFAVGVYR